MKSHGKNKRNTANKRSKKFNRETKQLGASMAKGKRNRGAGRSPLSSSAKKGKKSGGGRGGRGIALDDLLHDVASNTSAAVCDPLDARSVLNMLMKEPGPRPPPNTAAAAPAAAAPSSSKPASAAATFVPSRALSSLDASKLEEVRALTVRQVDPADALPFSKKTKQQKQQQLQQERGGGDDDDDDADADADAVAADGDDATTTTTAFAAAAAAASSSTNHPLNRNRYERKGEAHAFWREQNVHPTLQAALSDMHFTHPTPVQERVLPAILSKINVSSAIATTAQQKQEQNARKNRKRDVIVSSETGSGKTLLFALPTLQHLLVSAPDLPPALDGEDGDEAADDDEDLDSDAEDAAAASKKTKATKPNKTQQRRRERTTAAEDAAAAAYAEWDRTRTLQALILTPTRELAEQIHRVFTSLAAKCDRRAAMVACILGGMAWQKQQRIMNRRPHVLIATPGRVWDLVQKNEGCYLGHSISRRLTFLVLDEADRLLQSGHYHDLRSILDRVHCEVLPSGLLVGGGKGVGKTRVVGPDGETMIDEDQDGDDGGGEQVGGDDDDFQEIDAEDAAAHFGEGGALQAGSWDPVKNKFIPAAAGSSKKKQQQQHQPKVIVQNDDDDDEDDEDDEEVFEDLDSDDYAEVDEEANGDDDGDGDGDGDGDDGGFEGEEDEEGGDEDFEHGDDELEADDDDEEEQEQQEHHSKKQNPSAIYQQKDFVRPMATPPPPPAGHRPITIVTSATLTLQVNFSHRNFRSKHYLQTNAVNTLARVLQDLGIKERDCDVFNLTIGAGKDGAAGAAASSSGGGGAGAGVVQTLHEAYTRCPANQKELNLVYFLKNYCKNDRVVIFVNAISMLRRLSSLLTILGFRACRLHSSMQQRSRLGFIDKFRSGALNVLIATDIAARGLDVDGVKYIVHYQAPRSTDAYIHRCGRTARCGGTGFSLLLVQPEEFAGFRQLLRSMGRAVASMEVFSPENASRQMKELHEALKMALQIDRLEKEVAKSSKNQRWIKTQGRDAEIDADDMINPELAQENREKTKAAKILRRRLAAMMRDMAAKGPSGRGAFLSTPRALGAQEAVQGLRERTKRQLYME